MCRSRASTRRDAAALPGALGAPSRSATARRLERARWSPALLYDLARAGPPRGGRGEHVRGHLPPAGRHPVRRRRALRPIGVPEALPGYDADPTDADDAPTLEIGLRLLGRGSGGTSSCGRRRSPSSAAPLLARAHAHHQAHQPNDAPRTWAWQPDAARRRSRCRCPSIHRAAARRGRELRRRGHGRPRLGRSGARPPRSPHGRVLCCPSSCRRRARVAHRHAEARPAVPRRRAPGAHATFSNPTEADAKWMLCPAPLPRSDPPSPPRRRAARAQAGRSVCPSRRRRRAPTALTGGALLAQTRSRRRCCRARRHGGRATQRRPPREGTARSRRWTPPRSSRCRCSSCA